MEGSLVAYKVFTNGSVLQASEINDNLMNQSVMVFSNSTTRAAAITSPLEGMLTWLEDVNRYENYNGTSWVPLLGRILQVVSTTKTDTFSTTSTSFADITGLNATITPLATSSKILVMCNVYASTPSTNTTHYGLLRNATDIARSTTATSVNASAFLADMGTTQGFNLAISFLDSPATTSSTVYKLAMRQNSGGTGYINRRTTDNSFGGVSTITLMEVAG
jgi:hypothetical protein